ncbi:hypothetical protein [Adhaeribacter terreus]|uniref:Uncharacterized protein n=1 Tax=Adhaeribacter terreus TaxID=529703 RepID=A0ABW0ED27_9BACT
MNISSKIIFYGSSLILVILSVAGIDKKIRDNKILLKLSLVTFLFGSMSFLIKNEETADVISFMFGPFIYIISYSLFRQLYKGIYDVEPTYTWLTAYDWEELRQVNVFDKLVHVLPLLLGFFLPLFIG